MSRFGSPPNHLFQPRSAHRQLLFSAPTTLHQNVVYYLQQHGIMQQVHRSPQQELQRVRCSQLCQALQ